VPVLIGMAWGTVLAYTAGGRLGKIDDDQLKQFWFVIPLFVAQGLARGRLGTEALGLGVLLWAGVGMLVCGFVFWRVTDIGLRLVGVGFAANLLVVLLNGHMPFSFGGSQISSDLVGSFSSSGFYGVSNQSTMLGFLGDVIPLTLFGDRYLLSAGDVLLGVGATLYLWGLMFSVQGAESRRC
jgi:hypothetical protein